LPEDQARKEEQEACEAELAIEQRHIVTAIVLFETFFKDRCEKNSHLQVSNQLFDFEVGGGASPTHSLEAGFYT